MTTLHTTGRNHAEIQEAIDSLDMEAWLDREGVEYRVTRGHRGKQANIKECPKCGNDNWKVYIGLETGLGNCFHGDCEARFNKWSFIKAYLGDDNRLAVENIKQAAQEQGWRPPVLTAAPSVTTSGPLKFPSSLPLPIKGKNLKYLTKRGISIEIAQHFGLRYCHEGKFWWTEEGGKRCQVYDKRIIIPIYSLEGELVSFQGRDVTGTADKKYLFPPGFASTGSILYNGHNAVGAERVLVGEGVFDVMAQKIALDEDMALRDVVPLGTFGKHLSHGDEDSQLAKFKQLKAKGLKSVTFMFDGEPKAIDAAIEAGLQCHSIGLLARVAILPAGCDPNEVPPLTVRNAYWQAVQVTPLSAIGLRLKHCTAK